MDLEKIKLSESSFNDIALLLDHNYGEVTLESLNEETFIIFLASTIEAAYKVGVRDGMQLNEMKSVLEEPQDNEEPK